ncbi:hypothetical protein DYBT9275_03405 [Dyadobacter sp. CECT 9275]|uniref:PKD domain-containing protein n=1 Tax=Dyadobacter helix TaxID=2822344 RepID=A0A916JG38_9BACT|nr:gliding motility-associated C-terminal domain-containing protein [Dyadobacter sp. CECT 9275]CAG5004607.1 hypothetical protein DYBT9275_03405 [Dyadobacter sp. CECT 9275]
MGKTLRILSLIFLVFIPCLARGGGMSFVRNMGQWDSEILFRADIPGGFLFLKNHAIVYVFYDASEVTARHGRGKTTDSQPAARKQEPYLLKAHGVEVNFINAQTSVKHTPVSPVVTRHNYFLGADQRKWTGNVQGFEEVLYENIYEGINLRVYWHQFSLKYEFVVKPGADVSRINLKYSGADQVNVNEKGQLEVKTPINKFGEEKPYSFQTIQKKAVEVPSHFVQDKDQSIHFGFPKGYDKSQTLIIDPELIFSTYSGSVPDNWGHTATYDSEGNLFTGGTVFGTGFPVSVGAYQIRFDGMVDVAIMKFSPDGSELLYATYLGGASTDLPTSLIVNNKNELVILGTTSSRDFPVTGTAFQKNFGGGTGTEPLSGLPLGNGSDIFLSKLSADGKQLTASTYLGGSGNDGVCTSSAVKIKNYGDSFRGEVVVDKDNNVLLTSSTNSGNFPLKNPVSNILGGRQDAVVAKFSQDLSTLLWSTYLGGNQLDAGFSVKETAGGDIYVTGITQSTNLATHTQALQPRISGAEDAFVARFSGGALAGLTYLGTAEADAGYLVDLDASLNVYVYGLSAGKYPVSTGVYSNTNSGQFIHALDPSLSRSVFSTVIGSGKGTPDISPTAFLVNECGNIYIAGWGGNVNSGTDNNLESTTNGLPVTSDALQRITTGNNFYVAILEEGAKSLLYATFFGSSDRSGTEQGDHVDGGTSRFNKNGEIYHATCACGGSRFPVTPQAWSRTNRSSNCNNAAFKIDIDRLKADFDVYAGSQKDVTRGCAPLSLSFVNMSEGGIDYIWEVNGSTISREADEAAYVFRTPGQYTVTLKAYNRLSCKRIDIAQKTIVVETLSAKILPDTTVCENTKVQLWASGGTQYKWTPAEGMENPLTANPSMVMKETQTFSVEISNASGCKFTGNVKITVNKKQDFIEMPDVSVCPGAPVILSVTGDASEYRWKPNGSFPATTGSSVTVTPTQTTTYVVEGIYTDGCRPLREITVNVDRSFEPSFEISQSGGSCNEAFQYSISNNTRNAQRFEWDLGSGDTFTTQHVENHVFGNPGTYTITLTAYSAAGCALSVSKKLIAQPAFELANVITPNGDGKNDRFVVPVAGSTLEIFNRWGKQVYKSVDYKSDWGKGIANGTYFYVVDTPDGHHCKGWLEVVE